VHVQIKAFFLVTKSYSPASPPQKFFASKTTEIMANLLAGALPQSLQKRKLNILFSLRLNMARCLFLGRQALLTCDTTKSID